MSKRTAEATENGECTSAQPCAMMSLLIEDTDATKKGGIAFLITQSRVALQGNKRGARYLFLECCPWCRADISGRVTWKF